jgi:hypothetical protein
MLFLGFIAIIIIIIIIKRKAACVCSYFNFILDVPGSSISFNPADESITKVLRQSLGPIGCSAQCNPHCQFHWIKPDGTVVDRPNLEIPRLSVEHYFVDDIK